MSADEIRCYLFYAGQCLRFYPNDIINIIPELFVKSKEVRKEFCRLMDDKELDNWIKRFDVFKNTLKDTLFDHFYEGLVGESPDIEVPELEVK